MYPRLRAALFAFPAETAHRATIAALRLLSVPPFPALLWRLLGPRDPVLAVRALGLEFPSPVCLAAGFDKDARAYRALAGFGFGAVEVGTVTPRPQPGNPQPRLFRLPADRALINRMGFRRPPRCATAAAAWSWERTSARTRTPPRRPRPPTT